LVQRHAGDLSSGCADYTYAYRPTHTHVDQDTHPNQHHQTDPHTEANLDHHSHTNKHANANPFTDTIADLHFNTETH
jgi:hypothetical protein